MKIIIQCAGDKQPNPNYTGFHQHGQYIEKFLAHPNADHLHCAHPDFECANGITWRETLAQYNQQNRFNNPQHLSQAYELYRPATYGNLVAEFGVENVYILSAGWGLIRADYLIPDYDITFSASAKANQRRRDNDDYKDFNHLAGNTEPLIFLGGISYQPLLFQLTQQLSCDITLVYRSANPPALPINANARYMTRNFQTPRRTNWHYEAANALIQNNHLFD
jgi:hypothetical protein